MEFSQDQVRQILNRIEDRLAKMRKRKTEFYSECGVSSAAYSLWNTGKTTPTPATLRKIADYLNVSYSWLATGQGEQEAEDDEMIRLRDAILNRPELRMLFKAAEDAPTSEILSATAQILRYKEQSK